MPVVALVTARAAREIDEDLPPLEAALHAAGVETQIAEWDDPGIDWRKFDLAVIRSTWDYVSRLEEFLAWAERAVALTRLANPAPLIRWNTDKHYLATLRDAGVPVIPSDFIEPGQDAAGALTGFLKRHAPAEFVVKPAVGAGSRDVFRYGSSDRESAVSHAQRLLAQGSVVLQPYLDRVDEEGETALLYFDGRFSHAIRKGPMLKRGQGPVTGLFATERIQPGTASPEELRVAERALAAIPCNGSLYARVDLIRDSGGAPRVLELELTEPSVFLAQDPGSAARFAQAILVRALPFSESRTS